MSPGAWPVLGAAKAEVRSFYQGSKDIVSDVPALMDMHWESRTHKGLWEQQEG